MDSETLGMQLRSLCFNKLLQVTLMHPRWETLIQEKGPKEVLERLITRYWRFLLLSCCAFYHRSSQPTLLATRGQCWNRPDFCSRRCPCTEIMLNPPPFCPKWLPVAVFLTAYMPFQLLAANLCQTGLLAVGLGNHLWKKRLNKTVNSNIFISQSMISCGFFQCCRCLAEKVFHFMKWASL